MKVYVRALVAAVLLAIGARPDLCFAAHTKVTLLADTRAVVPGSHFQIGVRLEMDPGWHTYWMNPGEAGLATEIKWSLPRGITAGEPEWPLPQKHIETGDVLTYGYSGETLLLVPMTAASNVAPGTILKLSADVSWLECASTCVPGDAQVSLSLPVAHGPAQKDHQELFDHYRSRVPGPLTDTAGLAVSVRAASGVVTIGVDLETPPRPGSVDFYPELVPHAQVGRPDITIDGRSARLRIAVTAYEPVDSACTFRGVLLLPGTGGGTRAYALHTELPATFFSSGGEAPARKDILDGSFTTIATGSQHSLALYLLLAFIGGLLLNIMPCVLPVIALKVFGLVKMAGDEASRVKKLGWAFSSGILVSFLALALLVILLQAAGQQVGWGFQFQEPLFVVVMAAIVFVFGLSLFGVFEIRLPSRAIEGVGNVLQKQERGQGYTSSFFEGMFATVLATPCTAPFLGTALGFAFSQPAWAILLIFATVAAGMAFPYILLTARPAWMKFLPKPGAWMETAKQFMGFLMMATLLWLLYILGKQLGMEAIVWTGAFLLVVGVACWVVGRFLTLSSGRARTFVVWGVAIVLVAAGWRLFMTDVFAAREILEAGNNEGAVQEEGGIAWERFDKAHLESLLDANKPVLIDFTAEWCLTCKVNEKTVLSDPEVIARIKQSGIVPIRADWTNRNPEITALLAKFGRSGVPLYVLFPQGDPTRPIVLPEVITKNILLDAVDRSVKSVTQTG
jgi:thiol:disulfide interchange protein/DsbC/DsbD-like thiol-disulfide interchange protein